MPPNRGLVLSYENEDAASVSSFEKRGYRTVPILHFNGKRLPPNLAARARPGQTLLSFIRDVLGLTGTKLGCGEGGCGACSVVVSRLDCSGGGPNDSSPPSIQHFAANACLMPVLATDGFHITTVEGIGSVKGGLHPIQSAMTNLHGSQCGFCTPGIVVAIYALLAQNPTTAHVEEHLDGNLCRCTGYRPIWDAARTCCIDAGAKGSTSSLEEEPFGPCGTPCRSCPERDICEMECNTADQDVHQRKGSDKGRVDTGEKEAGNGAVECSVSAAPANLCCSSSSDKMREFFPSQHDGGPSHEWRNLPNKMFPAALASADSDLSKEVARSLVVVDRSAPRGGTWLKPATLTELLGLLREYEGGCKLVVGNTEVGIETKFKNAFYPRYLFPSRSIKSLYGVAYDTGAISIGSCTPLTEIQRAFDVMCKSTDCDSSISRIASPIHDMLRWFASTQIRNVACLGGNLVTASPISDMNPMLASLNAKLIIASLDGDSILRRMVPVSDFFLRYRTVDLKPNEMVESITIPSLRASLEYVSPFKQARRREDDISIVTSGMRAKIGVDPGKGYVIEEIVMAFGGMAPTTILAPKTAASMAGKPLDAESFRAAGRELLEELYLHEDVPGGQAEYRRALASSFVYQFYLFIVKELESDIKESSGAVILPPAPFVPLKEKSGVSSFISIPKPSTKGVQKYPTPKVSKGLEGEAPTKPISTTKAEVGKAKAHASAPLHCTGEALYCDDIPTPPGTLEAHLILAAKCGTTLVSIDVTPALGVPGVVAVYTHKDLIANGGINILGPIKKDEFCFLPIGEKVAFVGQVVGICVADSLESAELGASSVMMGYEETGSDPIVTIAQAIEADSFYDFAKEEIDRGNVDAVFDMQPRVNGDKLVTVAGFFRSGGQEHFYLETNSTLVVPSESATNLTVYSSTQAPSKTQDYCAAATGTPAAKVVVRMKRMGGGFGGKESRSAFSACAAAVAAKIIDRPVRITLSRAVDMSITGTRHSFMTSYRAAARVDADRKVHFEAFDAELFNNAGSAFDLSGPVLCRALLHIDGCYNWPNFRAVGQVCKTAQPPHTAFRGFGGPQGIAACEHVIDQLALACDVPGDQIRRDNMYKDGESTPFGMVIGTPDGGKWNVPKMWDDLSQRIDILSRREANQIFNAKNKWKKRGIGFVPTKFGIAFTEKSMNQGGALVHLYTDGTVLVSHGGTEMGQGLHTKVCQITAQVFGIPLEDVYINDTSTDKVPNSIPTAASMSTDMYGMATLDACTQILKRLEPYKKSLQDDATLADVAKAAHWDRVNLSAQGFFKLMDKRCGFDFKKEKPADLPLNAPENSWKGQPFNYFTQGVAFAEVEIDVLTGNHRVLAAEVTVDVGSSINPVIDIGQIEGAFIQGMGWSTIEECIYADREHPWLRPAGKVFTTGPGTYKIPAFNDVPESFNVSLMQDVDNPFAVHSSKAIGEPPFFLGSSVFYAIKDAIAASREEHIGSKEYFEMSMPGTSERIRMACADDIASECIAKSGKDAVDFQPKASY